MRHRHRRRASAACNIISPAVISRPMRASKTRRHFSTRSMTSAAGKGLRLSVDLSRPVYALKPNRQQLTPVFRFRMFSTRRLLLTFRPRSVFPISIRLNSTSDRTSKASLAFWRCSVQSTASTARFPISRVITICTLYLIR